MIEKRAYLEQLNEWPAEGKHILAQFDEKSVIVYQAYRPEIGLYAEKHQRFGGEFSYSRMSWIKTNFLWMMYRSGWGTKLGQEVTLAIRLKRDYFEEILNNAFPSTNYLGLSEQEWKESVSKTDVRLQWDPDHDPYGKPVSRRAIQLGLRNKFLEPFKGEGLLEILDISRFVKDQRVHINNNDIDKLLIPYEKPYPVNEEIKIMLGM